MSKAEVMNSTKVGEILGVTPKHANRLADKGAFKFEWEYHENGTRRRRVYDPKSVYEYAESVKGAK